MQKLLKSIFFTGFIILLNIYPPAFSQTSEIEILSKKLEKILNEKNQEELYQVFSNEIAKQIEEKYNQFIKEFPSAKWQISNLNNPKDNLHSIDILVTGRKQFGDHTYYLKSNQKLNLIIMNGRIVKEDIFSDYSILNTNKENLNLTLGMPNVVLTGSKYDIDIIIKEPLKERIIAGGLIELNSKSDAHNKQIELEPIGSGGLFKSVRAPYQPGNQRWAAIIAHPEGIISITKNVRVVSKLDGKNI